MNLRRATHDEVVVLGWVDGWEWMEGLGDLSRRKKEEERIGMEEL